MFVVAGCAACIPHATVLPRVADVAPPQEIHAAVRADGRVWRGQGELGPGGVVRVESAREPIFRLQPDDLVEIDATAGQTFGPIRVRTPHPELAPIGWFILVVGGLASIVAPAIAVATTTSSMFSGIAESTYALLGAGAFTASVVVGGLLIYFGNNPLVVTGDSPR